MDFAKVIVKSNKKEADKIKELVKKLKDHNPTMIVSHLRYGELGGELLVSFNIDTDHHEMILGKLILNNMNVWPHDSKTKALITKIKDKLIKGTGSQTKGSGWDDLMKKAGSESSEESAARVEKLVRAGRYEDLLKLSKDLRNKSLADLAKDKLADGASIAIDKMTALALTKKYEADKVIKQLLAIGSEPALINMGRNDIAEKAGQAAIDICSNYKDFTWDMMKIISDNKISKITNLKAAAKFSAKIFEDPETFNVEIENAVKNINVRWLQLNMDTVKHLLTKDEIDNIDKLISYIRSRRS